MSVGLLQKHANTQSNVTFQEKCNFEHSIESNEQDSPSSYLKKTTFHVKRCQYPGESLKNSK